MEEPPQAIEESEEEKTVDPEFIKAQKKLEDNIGHIQKQLAAKNLPVIEETENEEKENNAQETLVENQPSPQKNNGIIIQTEKRGPLKRTIYTNIPRYVNVEAKTAHQKVHKQSTNFSLKALFAFIIGLISLLLVFFRQKKQKPKQSQFVRNPSSNTVFSRSFLV